MFTDVQIINQGLSKIGQSRINRIDPPVTSLEVFVSIGYVQWKRSELTKRKWVFARENSYAMTLSAEVPGVDRPYKYGLPPDCLRPLRTRRTEWRQAGRNLFSASNALYIDYIRNVEEDEFDPLFVDVLAYRVAMECVEFVTQSNTKKADAKSLYDEAIATASQANAFTVGSDNYGEADESFEFLTSRYV